MEMVNNQINLLNECAHDDCSMSSTHWVLNLILIDSSAKTEAHTKHTPLQTFDGMFTWSCLRENNQGARLIRAGIDTVQRQHRTMLFDVEQCKSHDVRMWSKCSINHTICKQLLRTFAQTRVENSY